MASPENDGNKKKAKGEFIGVVQSADSTAPDASVYYLEGSTFIMRWKSGTENIWPKDALMEANNDGKFRPTDPKKFEEIIRNIQDDGTTKTHRADGTPKSAADKAAQMLKDEHIIIKGNDGVERLARDDEREKKRNQSNGRDIGSFDPRDPSKVRRKHSNASDGDDEYEDASQEENDDGSFENEYDDDIVDYDDEDTDAEYEDYDDEDEYAEPNSASRRRAQARRKQRETADLNGDGVIDEFDEYIAKEQQKSVLVILYCVVGIILSIFLFFFVHAATSSLFRGEAFDLLPDSQNIQQQDDQKEQSNENSESNSDNENSESSIVLANRTDFDPETAVISKRIANANEETKVSYLFSNIRDAIKNANLELFEQCVDLNAIAGSLAPAYAMEARIAQNLSEGEEQEVMFSFHPSFMESERKHVLNKDPYGSIFGGRLREVRIDDANPNKMYAVMESAAGDHQRVCFIVTNVNPNEDEWIINGVMAPREYAKMIQKGKIEE